MNVKVSYFISKNIHTVYQAIIDKNHLSKYFVSFASNDLDKAELITWKWEDYNAECQVDQIKTTENQLIEFYWGSETNKRKVAIKLTSESDEKTKITITEFNFEPAAERIKEIAEQTQGWTDFCCSLKAYLYTGINLRK
ncbi:MAG: SRPBCC domain-containing protein [Crocinitomicaceae bacterium]